MPDAPKPQADKFRDMARELEWRQVAEAVPVWLKPTWMRAWILVMLAPAAWVIWWAVGENPDRFSIVLAALAWSAAAGRLWFWNLNHRFSVR